MLVAFAASSADTQERAGMQTAIWPVMPALAEARRLTRGGRLVTVGVMLAMALWLAVMMVVRRARVR